MHTGLGQGIGHNIVGDREEDGRLPRFRQDANLPLQAVSQAVLLHF
jgi:hypothetical protein